MGAIEAFSGGAEDWSGGFAGRVITRGTLLARLKRIIKGVSHVQLCSIGGR